MMNKFRKILSLIALVILLSCEEQGLFVNCQDCTTDEPLETNLEIKLELNNNTPSTLVKIYEGNLEDSVLYSSNKIIGTSASIPVTLNKKYSVTATYYIQNEKYVAVDAAYPRVKYDKSQCDDPCYFTYDRIIDLRLRGI